MRQKIKDDPLVIEIDLDGFNKNEYEKYITNREPIKSVVGGNCLEFFVCGFSIDFDSRIARLELK